MNFTECLLPLSYCKIQIACAIPSLPLPSVGLLPLAKWQFSFKNECGLLSGFKVRHPTTHTQSSEQESMVLHVWVCLPSLGYPLKVGLQSAAQAALSWVKLQAKPPESIQPSSALPIVFSKGQNSYSYWQKWVVRRYHGRLQPTKPLGISLVPTPNHMWLSPTAPRDNDGSKPSLSTSLHTG